ncbi:hypothetical protein V5F79_08340 [Xanthobacter flavus]|uniref:hypothetical protein n=1 Tax=Xanthobacter flavus TaxID=281 RepID=UPI00372828B9
MSPRRRSSTPGEEPQADAEARFAAYVAAAKRAQSTFDFQDGKAAGAAWRDFLATFLPAAGAASVHNLGGRR